MIEGSRSGAGCGSVPLTNGSGSESRRPKNMWTRNTTTVIIFIAHWQGGRKKWPDGERQPRQHVAPAHRWEEPGEWLPEDRGCVQGRQNEAGAHHGHLCREGLWNFTNIVDPYHQCCGSGMFIPDPDIYPSRISDPKTSTKGRVEKNVCQTFFCSHKFHKIVNYFIFEMLKK